MRAESEDKFIFEVMGMYNIASEIFDEIFRDEEESREHSHWLSLIMEELGAKRIMDAAAGTGEQAIGLWETGAFDIIIANDLNNKMISRLKEKLKNAKIHYRDGWTEDTPLPFFGVIQSDWPKLRNVLPHVLFDVVFCLGIAFYHLMIKERFIETLLCWREILRPGGYVLVDIPANHIEIAKKIREGTYVSSPRAWEANEVEGRSGGKYIITGATQIVPLADSPIGFRSLATYIINQLSFESKMNRENWSLTSGGAILDPQAIAELAEATGFRIIDLPVQSPQLFEKTKEFLLQRHS